MAAISRPLFNQQTTLFLGGHNIGTEEARLVAEALKVEGCSITTLYLGNIKIGDEGTRLIAEALKVNRSITTLNLSGNDIGDKGARLIAKALKVQDCSITTLNLSGNAIGDEGTRRIAEALKINRSITALYLSGNAIGDEGARRIAKALKVQDCSITALNLSGNDIGDEGARRIAEALIINRSITYLDLDNNIIEDEGARRIAEALKVNFSITNLNLDNNIIGDEGARLIAEALKINYSITNLDLRFNNIGDEGIRVIQELLRNHQENKKTRESSLLSNLLNRLDASEPISDIRINRIWFSMENYEHFPFQKMRSLQSDADKHDVPHEYSSSLANLYKTIMSEPFPSYEGPVPHKFQEIYNSLSPKDKILIDYHICVLSGKPLGEEDYGASHAFENGVKFYAAVYNAIISKYEDIWKIEEEKRTIDGHIYKLALHANDLIERTIIRLEELSTPEVVFAQEWGSSHAKENLMRLALAMAIAEKPAASSSSTASSSGPSSS